MIKPKVFFITIVLAVLNLSISTAAEVIVSHAISMIDEPKYPADFTHFEYVNPDAPKGGTLTLYAIGTYDTFHRYAQGGSAAVGSGDLYDTLMTSSLDEAWVYYGLIAEKIEYPTDHTWIIFHINPKARFQDGKPITAEDVVFSFYKFFDEGVPQFKKAYEDVEKAEVLDTYRAKFTLKKGSKDLLISLATNRILPKHYWEDKDFSKPSTEVPLGSGPLVVSDYKMGQYVIYKRLEDYWAKDLPVMKGQLNFDYYRYDYYRDQTVAFEAFKAGEYDFRSETIVKNWMTQYTGSQFEKGYIIKEEIPHEIPQRMEGFVFNIQRPLFNDRRVRMALSYALDFEWLNKNLFYNKRIRTRSFFQNTKYEAKGLPSEEELKILEPFRGKIPEEVFTQEYNPPQTDGTGNIRNQIRQALRLLKEAGWEIKDKKLINAETNEPFEFELLLYRPLMERVAIPMQKNLERMGITMNIRMVDTTQYINRLRERDFDMSWTYYSAYHYPTGNIKIAWRSDYIDSTWNSAGVQDEVVDALVDGIEASQEDVEALLYYGRAFDRVVTWNHYLIPHWHKNNFWVAYWDKFSRPEIRPKYALGLDTWWVDPEKEKLLPERGAAK